MFKKISLFFLVIVLIASSCRKDPFFINPEEEIEIIDETYDSTYLGTTITIENFYSEGYFFDGKGYQEHSWQFQYRIKDNFFEGTKCFYRIEEQWNQQFKEGASGQIYYESNSDSSWHDIPRLYRYDPNKKHSLIYENNPNSTPSVIMDFNLKEGDSFIIDSVKQISFVVTSKKELMLANRTYPVLTGNIITGNSDVQIVNSTSTEIHLSPFNPNPVLMMQEPTYNYCNLRAISNNQYFPSNSSSEINFNISFGACW